MREIGSEFWDVPTKKRNALFPATTQWYLSGRSALLAIISELKFYHSVAIPDWCCDSIVRPFVENGFDVVFYPVLFEKGVMIQDINIECDVLFLMDFFGYSSSLPRIKTYKGIVIRDVTHSLFSAHYNDADYYFGSLRKWCGVWTGGFAWTQDGHKLFPGDKTLSDYVELRCFAMEQKEKYLVSGDGNKYYLRLFDDAESKLDGIGIYKGSDRDILLAEKLDVDLIRKRRRRNAFILIDSFPDWLLFRNMKPSDCPMFVPVMIPNGKRDELRQYLIKSEIYCPIHWPTNSCRKLFDTTKAICQDELSLVCDQRYNEDDMCRVVNTINYFIAR